MHLNNMTEVVIGGGSTLTFFLFLLSASFAEQALLFSSVGHVPKELVDQRLQLLVELVHIYINGIMVILAQLYQTLMKDHIMFWFKMLIFVKLLELLKY